MSERENNTSIEKEKSSKKKIIIAIAAVLLLLITIFGVAKVYNSPAKELEKLLNLGNRYLEEMDYEQAIVAFDAAIEIDPKNVDAYLGKADAYIGLGDQAMAIETLETGYLATGGNEAIKNRLFDTYIKVVEEAIEKGLYEEGKKAYERIVELGVENEGLLKKLEEFQDNRNEEENIAQADGQGEGELPYYELGFSSEDFTLAGYSVMDGNHIDDIEQAAATVIPDTYNIPGVEEVGDYIGWSYNRWDETSLRFAYCGSESYAWAENLYVYYEDGYIRICVDTNNGELPTEELSLFKGKVMINITSYKDALYILGIEDIVQIMEENGLSIYEFESQYGHTLCKNWSDEKGDLEIEVPEENWSFVIGFCDDTVSYISIGRDL